MFWVGSSLWNFRFFGLDVHIEIWTILLALMFYFDALLYIGKEVKRFQLNGKFLRLAAIVGMMGVVFSVFAHELAHAFVGSLYGAKITRLTMTGLGAYVLFEEMPSYATSLKAAAISAAGPLMNFIIAGVAAVLVSLHGESLAENTTQYVAVINYRLGKFNLLPIPILDGGRIVWNLGTLILGQEKGFYLTLVMTFLVMMFYIRRKKGRGIEERLADL